MGRKCISKTYFYHSVRSCWEVIKFYGNFFILYDIVINFRPRWHKQKLFTKDLQSQHPLKSLLLHKHRIRNHLVRIYYTSSPKSKSQLICYPNRKIMDIMINNVVLLFSATNGEIPYEHLLQYWIVNQQLKVSVVSLGRNYFNWS